MKKQTFFPVALYLLVLAILGGCKNKFDEKKYLAELLNNIEQVKSASYFLTASSFPILNGDTLTASRRESFYKEFSNPADTAIGSTYGWFYSTDTSKLYSYYDGNSQIYVDYDIKTIEIDSFKVNRFPFRTAVSFFNRTKNIIKYVLTSGDSLQTEFRDCGDSLLFRLTINSNKTALFYGKVRYYNGGGTDRPGNTISKYDIWINKTTGLPYKTGIVYFYEETKTGSVYWEECTDVQINKMDIKDFIPSRYLPPDFDIAVKGSGKAQPLEDLTGTTAPDWTLPDYNNEPFALNDFKSKALVIQFSGIGCAPCHAAIPFLKQLTEDYRDRSFELVRIECWSNNVDVITKYCSSNGIKYRFLISDREIDKKYNAIAVPIFFVLDGNKKIHKIIRGYSKETTDKEIRDAIEKLL